MTESNVVDIEPRLPVRRPVDGPLLPLGEVVAMPERLPMAYADKIMLPGQRRPQWFCMVRDETGESRHWARSQRQAQAMARLELQRYADQRMIESHPLTPMLRAIRQLDVSVQRDLAFHILEGLPRGQQPE